MVTRRTFVILGADGDLAARLLLPGLGELLMFDRRKHLRVVGVGRSALGDDEWRARLRRSMRADEDDPLVAELMASARYRQADATSRDDLQALFDDLPGPVAVYFALPPAVAHAACETLADMSVPDGTVLALEKPFGTDLESAREFNGLLARLPDGVQVVRVDHFLGKTTVLSVTGLRFANHMFESVWHRDHVERVEVVFDESLGLEGRAGYYDHAGALLDMVQSHLLQVLALIAMEPPPSVEPDAMHRAMADVLEQTRVWGSDATTATRRARYTAGSIGSRVMPDYAAEDGVDPANETETLTEVTLQVNSERWHGVPFVLRSGKAIGHEREEIVVTFREPTALPVGFAGDVRRRLRIGMKPERITLDVAVNRADDLLGLRTVELSATTTEGRLGAYGEVLGGILDGDELLSVSGDMAEACWRIVTPIRAAWAEDRVPLEEYPAGSGGPSSWPTTPHR
ncbi:glucose-6-phosphate dehydrogenase [Agromyces sp. SYSU T00194]|uniref:glucose-6-phosphate dehydrogenase n=1 Tax=Agromyces chitinivorans TaxID=3158560 RepID=UPI0033917761